MTVFMYVNGDATEPVGVGTKIIAHVVNDRGAWGAGFSGALSAKWPTVEEDYRLWRFNGLRPAVRDRFELGNTKGLWIDPPAKDATGHLVVMHMLAQQGLPSRDNPRPLRYDALGSCLLQVSHAAKGLGASVHMPRIGCGLARGSWDIVEPMIFDALYRQGINTYVYDWKEGN